MEHCCLHSAGCGGAMRISAPISLLTERCPQAESAQQTRPAVQRNCFGFETLGNQRFRPRGFSADYPSWDLNCLPSKPSGGRSFFFFGAASSSAHAGSERSPAPTAQAKLRRDCTGFWCVSTARKAGRLSRVTTCQTLILPSCTVY